MARCHPTAATVAAAALLVCLVSTFTFSTTCFSYSQHSCHPVLQFSCQKAVSYGRHFQQAMSTPRLAHITFSHTSV